MWVIIKIRITVFSFKKHNTEVFAIGSIACRISRKINIRKAFERACQDRCCISYFFALSVLRGVILRFPYNQFSGFGSVCFGASGYGFVIICTDPAKVPDPAINEGKLYKNLDFYSFLTS
jgi:hypothetical protein